MPSTAARSPIKQATGQGYRAIVIPPTTSSGTTTILRFRCRGRHCAMKAAGLITLAVVPI